MSPKPKPPQQVRILTRKMPQTLPQAPGMLHKPLYRNPHRGHHLPDCSCYRGVFHVFRVKNQLPGGGSLGLQLQHHGQHTAHAAIKGTVFITRVTD